MLIPTASARRLIETSVRPFDGGELGSFVEDRVAASLSVAASATGGQFGLAVEGRFTHHLTR